MARLINPEPRTTIYDPACGSGGLLIKPRLLFEHGSTQTEKSAAPQDLRAGALTRHYLRYGKDERLSYTTLSVPICRSATPSATRISLLMVIRGLKRFDYVLANPMWNQDGKQIGYNDALLTPTTSWGRYHLRRMPRVPPVRFGLRYGCSILYASLTATGRAAIVLDTGAVSRGSSSEQTSRERGIRKQFIENDLIEAVILLPENLFYNTTAPGIILLLNRSKPEKRKASILVINLSKYFVNQKPKNVLTDEGIDATTEVYRVWESREKLSKIITLEDARETDYNLNPSQFVDVGDEVEHRPIYQILADLTETRIAREKADKTLGNVLMQLGLSGEDYNE